MPGKSQGIFIVSFHSQVQGFQSDTEVEGILRRGNGSQIAHQVRCHFDNICRLSKALGIYGAMVCLIGACQPGKFLTVLRPIKIAGIHNGAADSIRCAIHILCRGVCDNICSPCKGSAEDRRRKGVIYNERHPVLMGSFRKFLNIQDLQRGIRNHFSKDQLGVGLKLGLQLLFGNIRIHKSGLDAHIFHRVRNQIIGPAVNGGRRNNMIARIRDIEYGIKIRRLAR